VTETAEISIRRRDGALLIGSPSMAFQSGAEISAAKADLIPFLVSHDDYGNGWQRLRLQNLSLSGWACEANLRFEHGRLKALDWRVFRSVAIHEEFSWREIAARLEVMRLALSRQLERLIEVGTLERFEWGTVVCLEDTRDNSAITRLSYVGRTSSDK
jgi:hypothetical protein